MPTSSTAARRRRKRDFKNIAVEIAVIVTGVGIALFGEFAISEWNQQRKVARATKALAIEAKGDSGFLLEIIVVAPCVFQQIDRVRAHILDPANTTEDLPGIEASGEQSVLLLPIRTLTWESWTAAINDGVTPNMSAFQRISNTYVDTGIKEINQSARQLQEAKWNVDLLLHDTSRNAETNAFILRNLQQIEGRYKLSVNFARQTLNLFANLDYVSADTELKPDIDNMLRANSVASFCEDAGFDLVKPTDVRALIGDGYTAKEQLLEYFEDAD